LAALDLDKLERLARYEVHLDRKLERTLAMLLRLKAAGDGRGVIRLAKPPGHVPPGDDGVQGRQAQTPPPPKTRLRSVSLEATSLYQIVADKTQQPDAAWLPPDTDASAVCE